MKKFFTAIVASMLSAMLIIGCGNNTKKENVTNTKQEKTVKMAVPDGLPAVAMSKIIKEDNKLNNVTVDTVIQKTSELLATSILKGEPDIAVVPSNLAAQAYNKGAGYKILGTVGWGSLFLVSSDPKIDSIDAIKGKEVYNIGKGLTPDIALKGVLKAKGIDADKDVNLSYAGAASEITPLILTGKATVAVVPEPMLTAVMSKNKNVKVICNLNEEWKSILGSKEGYPQSTLIIKEDLLKEDKDFVNEFKSLASKDIEYVNNNRDEMGKVCEELSISVKAPLLNKALDNANLKFTDINSTKNDYIKYYEKLNEYEPKIIGGKVPDEKIFAE